MRNIGTALALTLAAVAWAEDDPAVEAARRIYPGARVERQLVELDEAQAKQVGAKAGTPLPSRKIVCFVALPAGGAEDAAPLGYAYLDEHIVRTLPETLLVAVDPAGRVRRVEVVEFTEPPDYLPSQRWFAQFEGRELSRELAIKRGIRTLAGATLSSRAATDAVRRVLAVHALLHGPTGS